MAAFPAPVLIADIGGTNARFALVGDNGAVTSFETVRTRDFGTIEDAVQTVVLSAGHAPQTAIIAAAGPIQEHGLDLTNCNWRIEADAFRASLAIGTLILFNDFDAQALALPFLKRGDVETLCGPPPSDVPRTMGVVGAGTGLGVGTLARAGNVWVPVGGEGGHVDLGPRTERETAIWPWLEKVDGRVSAEQILSGDGLINLYTALCRTDADHPIFKEAQEITGAALEEHDPQAVEALSIFCACLGRVAGDLALTVMAKGGLFLSGGIVGHILPFLRTSSVGQAFTDKAPHGAILKRIGLHAITRPMPALLGLENYALEPDAFAVELGHRAWGLEKMRG